VHGGGDSRASLVRIRRRKVVVVVVAVSSPRQAIEA